MIGKEKVRALFNQIEMLTQEERDLIVENVIVDRFTKGTVLLREGQITRRCYFVLEGCIREYTIKNGDDKTNAFYIEGDGTQTYVGGGKDTPSKHFLECLEECELMICNESMEEQIRSLVPRLDALIQEVSKQKIAEIKEEMTTFMHASPEERYTNLLEKKPSIFNRVAHHHIASYLGMKPQSLSRIRKRIFDKEVNNVS